MSRREERRDETELTRIRLLESDADHTDERLDAMQRIMIGILISLTLVAITGTINLIYAVATK